jgi:hypothetical protein
VLAIRSLLPVDLYARHKQELISVCICKITEADGKWNTRYRTPAAVSESSATSLRHEHVFSRRVVVERLLSAPHHIDALLRRVVGCLVTTKEHALLKVVGHKHPDLDGWRRFQKAEIRVLDLLEGKEADLAALVSDSSGLPLEDTVAAAPSRRAVKDLVAIVDGKIEVSFDSETEGKVALQELRLRRKAYNLRKYALNEQERALLETYAAALEKQGPSSVSNGKDASLATDLSAGWTASRTRLARSLAPLEREKLEIEAILQTIESVIVQVEAEMLKRIGHELP